MPASFLSWLWLHSESKTLISFFFLSFLLHLSPCCSVLFYKKPADSLQLFICKGISFVFLISVLQTIKQANKQNLTKKTPNFPPLFFYQIPTNYLKNYPTKIFVLGSLSHSFFKSFFSCGHSKIISYALILAEFISQAFNSLLCWMEMICRIWGEWKRSDRKHVLAESLEQEGSSAWWACQQWLTCCLFMVVLGDQLSPASPSVSDDSFNPLRHWAFRKAPVTSLNANLHLWAGWQETLPTKQGPSTEKPKWTFPWFQHVVQIL